MPRHRECGAQPATPGEISSSSKSGWGGARANSGGARDNAGGARVNSGGVRPNSGGARPGAGRKPAAIAEGRIAAALTTALTPAHSGDRWYCAALRPGMASIAIDWLLGKGFTTFLPRIERELPDRQHRLVAMFPGYLFVRFDALADPWRPITQAPGLTRLFGTTPERPTPMPLGLIERLTARATADGVVLKQPTPRLAPLGPGQRVRLTAGAFEGFEAIHRLSTGNRVRLLLSLFSREVEMELTRDQVEPVEA